MATNTNYYDLPIPESTDYVAAGYQAIANLGSSVDTLLSQNPLGGFRNRLINGNFDIWQRGTSFSLAASAYTSDRWLVSMSGGTTSVSRSALSTTDPVTMGAPGSTRFAIEAQNLGQSAASHFVALQQRIENVGTLAGETVTVSFHARSGSGSPKVGVSLDQFFGTGGSPSSSVLGTGQSVTINTVWTRYSLTFSVANLTGKTIGTAGNDWLGLNLWLSAGSDFATRAGSIGLQTSQIFVTGVQVESGAKTTPLEVRPQQTELALCQRYYFRTPPGSAFSNHFPGFAQTATLSFIHVTLPTPFRVAPTSVAFSALRITDMTSGALTVSTITVDPPAIINCPTLLLFVSHPSFGGTGQPRLLGNDNNANGWLELVAEL